MAKLANRKTRLAFETDAQFRGRALVVTCEPFTLVIREKGRRHGLPVSWHSIYTLAAMQEANRKRSEKLAAKKAKEAGRIVKVKGKRSRA